MVLLFCLLFTNPVWGDSPQPYVYKGDVLWEKSNLVNQFFIQASVSINGSSPIKSIIDTGASMTAFPYDYLKNLGYHPLKGPVLVPQASGKTVSYIYQIPYPEIIDANGAHPLGTGSIDVYGIVGAQHALIGANILLQDHLNLIDQYHWTLTINSASSTTPQN